MRGRLVFVLAPSALALTLAGTACDGPEFVILRSTDRVHTNGGTSGTTTGFGGTAGILFNSGGSSSACSGLQCSQIDCSPGNGGTTSVSGTIFDPAGQVPLYNVVVYIPSRPLDDVPEGVSCGKCDGTASGAPIAATLTRGDGTFILTDVPPGNEIPLVIQVGKWRRQIAVPHVAPCTDNPIGQKDARGAEMLTRLPRTRGEGHVPQIGVVTGHADALECLLRKIGIDDSEFTTGTGAGRVHMYVGCGNDSYDPPRTGTSRFAGALGGASFAQATSLYADAGKLAGYDILLFSCEGNQCADDKVDHLARIKDYADRGGRLFLGHTHYYWLTKTPAWNDAADYVGAGPDLPDPFPFAKIDTSFPKGDAFARWLVTVGASPSLGDLTIFGGQYSLRDTKPPRTQRWIYTDQNPTDGTAVEYMTMNAPVEYASGGGAGGAGGSDGGMPGPDDQCGRVVYTDLHVVSTAGDRSDQDLPFPSGCTDPATTPLTPQEKALEFMLFDLSSCVQPERKAPAPPDVIK